MKSGCGRSGVRRAKGPPRSNSQYHMPKTITLVTKIARPLPSSTRGLSPICPDTIL
ncbi:Uncharacterised protein [Mycobacteroides abscessus subsp. abscessus]|nr:Uncharacterised protein [Mycobacteroides abscessus subsp. abscessus]